jgi:hypothetical protein
MGQRIHFDLSLPFLTSLGTLQLALSRKSSEHIPINSTGLFVSAIATKPGI